MEKQAYAGKREGQSVLGYLAYTFTEAAEQCARATYATTGTIIHIRAVGSETWHRHIVERIDGIAHAYWIPELES